MNWERVRLQMTLKSSSVRGIYAVCDETLALDKVSVAEGH